MFTGIIEGLGVIRDTRTVGGGRRIGVDAGFDLGDTAVGDSIAVNGVCLTAVTVAGTRFEADASPETLTRTTLGDLKGGSRVNLERALRFTDRLGGHLVTGHIDGTAVMRDKKRVGNADIITIGVDPELSAYMVAKGSVAVDGISLTINRCGRDFFEVSVIPHTAAMTTIGFRLPGDRVNIETDIIGKYVKHFLTAGGNEEPPRTDGGPITRETLLKAGFV
jgi:riboflavin synthase